MNLSSVTYVLDSKDDITDELLSDIYNNQVKTLVLNYQFTRCQDLKETQEDYHNWQNQNNIFYRLNQKYQINEISSKILLSDNVTSLDCAFKDLKNLTKIDIVDTSNITSMRRTFQGAKSFNYDISNWDTSNVTDMFQIFNGAKSFDVKQVENWKNNIDSNYEIYQVTTCDEYIVKGDNFNAKKYCAFYCENNDANSCLYLGDLYNNENFLEHNLANAQNYYNKGCNLGDSLSCKKLDLISNQLLIDDLSVKCEQGVNDSCYKLANIYKDSKEFFKASKYYEISCNNKLSKSCNQLASLYQEGFGVNKDLTKSRNLYEFSCSLDDKEGCRNFSNLVIITEDTLKAECSKNMIHSCKLLGDFYEKNNKVTESVKYYGLACVKDGNSCLKLAEIYKTARLGKVDNNKAKEFYQKGCDFHNSEACRQLKEIELLISKSECDLNKGKSCFMAGVLAFEKQQYLESYNFIKKACSMKVSNSCNKLKEYSYNYRNICYQGNLDLCLILAHDNYRDKNYQIAFDMLKKSCDLKDIQSCNIVGNMYLKGEGVKSNIRIAKEYFKKACDEGFVDACNNLEHQATLNNCNSSNMNAPEYATYCKEECAKGDNESCIKVAILYEQGLWVEKNKYIAQAYYNFACKDGYKKACEKLSNYTK